MQRCMYVLFSRQNTKIGCFIRVFLRNSRYSHVALSLDEKLYRHIHGVYNVMHGVFAHKAARKGRIVPFA